MKKLFLYIFIILILFTNVSQTKTNNKLSEKELDIKAVIRVNLETMYCYSFYSVGETIFKSNEEKYREMKKKTLEHIMELEIWLRTINGVEVSDKDRLFKEEIEPNIKRISEELSVSWNNHKHPDFKEKFLIPYEKKCKKLTDDFRARFIYWKDELKKSSTYPKELFGIQFFDNVKKYITNNEILNVIKNMDKYSSDELFSYLFRVDNGDMSFFNYVEDFGSKKDLRVVKHKLFDWYMVSANKNFKIKEIRGYKSFKEKKSNFENICSKKKTELVNDLVQNYQINPSNFETNYYEVRGMLLETTFIKYKILSIPVYLQTECQYLVLSNPDEIVSELVLTLISAERWEDNNKDIGFKKIKKFTNEEIIKTK